MCCIFISRCRKHCFAGPRLQVVQQNLPTAASEGRPGGVEDAADGKSVHRGFCRAGFRCDWSLRHLVAAWNAF
uniref:Secreted protein n=1 Tax=Macrostomum lignano TaxID=282301 RepID=A0A1I8JBF0_9PLAT